MSLGTDWAGFFLVRHGQTDGNKSRYLGWSDEPLNATGHEQARLVARRLQGEAIDAIYASPFSRTRATAEPLARDRGLVVALRDQLKELNFGDYQGLSKIDHPLKVRFAFARRPIPGGESLQDVALRSMALMQAEVAPLIGQGQRIALVTHFWTSRVLLGSLLGLPIDTMLSGLGYKPPTGSILAVACTVADGRITVRATEDWTPPGEGDHDAD